MNKQDKELFDKIKSASDDVSLPEELSRDNIVKQLDGIKQIAIVEPVMKKKITKKHIIRAAVSAAAAIAIVIGIGAVGFDNNGLKISSGKTDSSTGDIDSGYNSATANYENIENIVADYYKNQLSKQKKSRSSGWFSSLFGSKSDDAPMVGSASTNGTLEESASVSDSVNSSYSKTNLQVDGVDEGDIVKTDGKNIYVSSGGRIYILDASDPKNMKTVNSFPVYVKENEESFFDVDAMYLNSGKLIIVASVYSYAEDMLYDESYYYSSCIGANESKTVISVYDITEPESPVMEFSYVCDGTYTSSRITDGRFIYAGCYDIPFGYCNENNETDTEVLKENCIPSEIVNGQEKKRIDANNICINGSAEPTSYQTVAMFNIDDCENTFYSGAALGSCDDVYCDGEYLFVSSFEYGEDSVNINGISSYSHTLITAYRIDSDSLTNIGEVKLPGFIIGQFSMDRYNGYFRVAVCSSYKNDSASFVFIVNDKFEIVSRTEAFGIGENMQSVRFMGDTAYAVTFYQTDPLFVIDLSDINNPVIAGELKIPGFSSYLHPIGDNLILGIGMGGDENGTDGSAEIKLFDVSDPKNPKCVDSLNIKNANINTNHKAFTSLGDGKYGVVLQQHDSSYTDGDWSIKVVVVSVDAEKISKTDYYNGPVNDDMYLTRIVYIGDNLFVVGDSSVIAYSITTNEKLGAYIYYDN